MLNFILNLFRRQKINLAHYPKPKTDYYLIGQRFCLILVCVVFVYAIFGCILDVPAFLETKVLSQFSDNGDKIDLADYPVQIDYGTLNSQQREAVDSILASCEAGYDTAEIPEMSQAEFDELETFFELYFGFCLGDKFGDRLLVENIARFRRKCDYRTGEYQLYAKINLDIYEQLKAHKDELDALVDAALSTLNEGTTEYKLKQIARYIANHGRYKFSYHTNNPLDLVDGGARCGAYSMLFYKMACRLGIKSYCCVGYVFTFCHAWNMVEIDGEHYFYDVTNYDMSGRLPWFLHSKTNWGREYKLNER